MNTVIRPGTHWVAYRNIDPKYTEYFDSFGLKMQLEVDDYLNKSDKPLVSGDEGERNSVLCDYWDLYYLIESQRRKSTLETVHNARFDMGDKSVNNRFNYFKMSLELSSR